MSNTKPFCPICRRTILDLSLIAYPTITEMENALGWKVRFRDLDLFRQHFSHGGMNHASIIEAHHTYRKKSKAASGPTDTSVVEILAKVANTPAPTPNKPALTGEARRQERHRLESRARSMNIRYGLDDEVIKKIAIRCLDTGCDLADQLRRKAIGVRLSAAKVAKRAQAAS
jgi:hypothetical protein